MRKVRSVDQECAKAISRGEDFCLFTTVNKKWIRTQNFAPFIWCTKTVDAELEVQLYNFGLLIFAEKFHGKINQIVKKIVIPNIRTVCAQ